MKKLVVLFVSVVIILVLMSSCVGLYPATRYVVVQDDAVYGYSPSYYGGGYGYGYGPSYYGGYGYGYRNYGYGSNYGGNGYHHSYRHSNYSGGNRQSRAPQQRNNSSVRRR